MMSDSGPPVNKTSYSEKELEHFKELILKEREETIREIETIKESLDSIGEEDEDRASSQAHHAGNIGSEEEEKETLYVLHERNLDKIKEINAALTRIENRTYGVCEASGEKIRKERLEAIPWARKSIKSEKNDRA